MALKKGDIIDEYKRFPDSCGLVVKVMNGGQGFGKIICCGHELTEEDIVPSFRQERGRKKGHLSIGMTLDEKKVDPDACGLRMMVIDGGAGFQEVRCCGLSIRAGAIQDFQFGQMRSQEEGNTSQSGTA